MGKKEEGKIYAFRPRSTHAQGPRGNDALWRRKPILPKDRCENNILISYVYVSQGHLASPFQKIGNYLVTCNCSYEAARWMFSSTVSFSYLRYSLAKQLYPLMDELLPLSRKETSNESYRTASRICPRKKMDWRNTCTLQHWKSVGDSLERHRSTKQQEYKPETPDRRRDGVSYAQNDKGTPCQARAFDVN